MNMKEITQLAEAQAAERVEAAKAALASIENAITQMKIAQQSALDELYAANAAKAKIVLIPSQTGQHSN